MTIESALSGVHIIEVATYLPGPVCTQLLAGLGAHVTKIVRPGGDPLSTMEPLARAYPTLNGGKHELELDLKTAEGAETLRSLASSADVLLDGLRPGALERLGLGSAALGALNPHLIYCALSGFGLAGTERGRAGHDLNFAALAGLLATTTVGDTPAMPGTQLVDMVSGLTAAMAILAALHARGTHGAGVVLDASMLGAARWLMTPWLAVAQAKAPTAGHILSGALACYRMYRTADDRQLAVAALEPHFWQRVCGALARPELAELQFAPDQAALSAELAKLFAQRSLAEWLTIFDQLDACVTPVLTLNEAAAGGVEGVRLPVRQWQG